MNEWEKLKAHCQAHLTRQKKQAQNRKVYKTKQTYFERFQHKLQNLPVESWWKQETKGQRKVIVRI